MLEFMRFLPLLRILREVDVTPTVSSLNGAGLRFFLEGAKKVNVHVPVDNRLSYKTVPGPFISSFIRAIEFDGYTG